MARARIRAEVAASGVTTSLTGGGGEAVGACWWVLVGGCLVVGGGWGVKLRARVAVGRWWRYERAYRTGGRAAGAVEVRLERGGAVALGTRVGSAARALRGPRPRARLVRDRDRVGVRAGAGVEVEVTVRVGVGVGVGVGIILRVRVRITLRVRVRITPTEARPCARLTTRMARLAGAHEWLVLREVAAAAAVDAGARPQVRGDTWN